MVPHGFPRYGGMPPPTSMCAWAGISRLLRHPCLCVAPAGGGNFTRLEIWPLDCEVDHLMGGPGFSVSMWVGVPARARARLRTHALAHVAHAHVAQGRLDTFGRADQSGFVDSETAEDRARRVTVQPAPLFNNLARDGVANGC
jgi:hypothetical protein